MWHPINVAEKGVTFLAHPGIVQLIMAPHQSWRFTHLKYTTSNIVDINRSYFCYILCLGFINSGQSDFLPDRLTESIGDIIPSCLQSIRPISVVAVVNITRQQSIIDSTMLPRRRPWHWPSRLSTMQFHTTSRYTACTKPQSITDQLEQNSRAVSCTASFTVMHATLNQRGPAYLNNIIKLNRRIWTSPSPFLYNQRSWCHEDTDQVWEARLLRLRSKYLEPDSSLLQEPSFCPGFSQSSKDLFVFRDHLDTVMHYRSHCCR